MIPHELVCSAQVPGRGGELRCYHHDRDFTIFVDDIELMSTQIIGSEEALAELAVERLDYGPARRVLVGGLGMGFTLARALALVGDRAVVEVAELVPEVIEWNRHLFGHCANHPLRDARTRVLLADVGRILRASRSTYDIVLLDVDNGPEGLSRKCNDGLYDDRGLAAARRALRPGGVFAVWSSGDDPRFERRLHRCGFDARRHRVRARRTKGPWCTIWVAATEDNGRRRQRSSHILDAAVRPVWKPTS